MLNYELGHPGETIRNIGSSRSIRCRDPLWSIVIDCETNVRWRRKRNEVCVAKCAAKGEELAYTCACREKQRRQKRKRSWGLICATRLYVSDKYILHIYNIHIHMCELETCPSSRLIHIYRSCDLCNHRLTQFISCRSIKHLTNFYQSYWFFL